MVSAATLGLSSRERMAARAEAVAELFGDFPSFCALLEIKLKSGGTKAFAYSGWNEEQRKFQRARGKSRRHIVVKPRQIGFSTLELARDLWFAVTRKAVNVLVVVHDSKMKKQLFGDLKRMANALDARGLLPKTQYDTVDEIVFADTGSAVRIVEAGATDRTAEGKGRSGTIHRLHATEMAFWKAAETTWTALDAAVPADAEVTIESTANGAGGLFYSMVEANRDGAGQYAVHFFPWYEHREYKCPTPVGFDPAPRSKWERRLRALGCNDQQIAWWRFKVDSPEWGLDKTLQEYPVDAESCFRASGRQWFSPETMDGLAERIAEPLERMPIKWQGRTLGELLVFERYDPLHLYVVGGDVSEGTGLDASSATVLNRRTGRVAATFWTDSLEPGDFGVAMAVIGFAYGTAVIAPERNNHGHAAIYAATHTAHYPTGRIFQTEDGKLGWYTDQVTRPVLIDDLGAAIRTGQAFTPDRAAVSECKTLVRNDKGKVEARDKGNKGGCRDDRVFSWGIAWQVRSAPDRDMKPAALPEGFF